MMTSLYMPEFDVDRVIDILLRPERWSVWWLFHNVTDIRSCFGCRLQFHFFPFKCWNGRFYFETKVRKFICFTFLRLIEKVSQSFWSWLILCHPGALIAQLRQCRRRLFPLPPVCLPSQCILIPIRRITRGQAHFTLPHSKRSQLKFRLRNPMLHSSATTSGSWRSDVCAFSDEVEQ